MISKPRKISGNKPLPAQNTSIELLNADGSGVFVSMIITKVGGSNDFSRINMTIDGRSVVATTFIGAMNAGLANSNNSGTVLTNSNVAKSITVQFNEPLRFSRSFRLVFNTANDANINNVVASAVIGEFIQNPLDEIVVPPRNTAIARRRKRK
jgi:hypothetical protein